jgi:transcriptional regulator with XRE-family HTH domain
MTATVCLTRLEERRQQLGMSMAALSKRSGVSLPTVQRILSGRHSTASFESVVAIASALGIEIEVKEATSAHEFLRDSALKKARRLVKMVQATSGLEGQAVDTETINELTDTALHSLMAGSRRKLWTD